MVRVFVDPKIRAVIVERHMQYLAVLYMPGGIRHQIVENIFDSKTYDILLSSKYPSSIAVVFSEATPLTTECASTDVG